MSMLLRDFRFAARMLLNSRGFTLISVLCLALGVAANSTVFSLVDGYWTRPLPVPDPGGLVYLSTATPASAYGGLSYAEYLDYESQASSFAGLAATERRGPILTGHGPAESTMSNVVSENYFMVLGIGAQLGRIFTAEDTNTGERVVVMSRNLWQRRFGGDPTIVGQNVLLGASYLVIGVAPKGFRGTELWQDSDFWIPMSSWDPSGEERNGRTYRSQTVIGRLHTGVPIDTARAEVANIARNLEQTYPKFNENCRATLATATEQMWRSTGYKPFVLLGIVTFVLLIACANLANLLLVRAENRSREIAVRSAMGAHRSRIVAQFMAESVLICALGTALGLLLATAFISLLPSVIIPPGNSYLLVDFRLDGRVLGFTLVMSILTVFAFGLGPALHASRTDLVAAMKGGSFMEARPGRANLRSGLVVVQMGLSIMLLVGAGLLVRTFVYSMNLGLGFEHRNVLVASIALPYGSARSHAFYRQLMERVREIHGVREATLALRAPLSGAEGGRNAEVIIAGWPSEPGGVGPQIKYTVVDLHYFRTLGIKLLAGRDFDGSDGPDRAPVVIINETMSRRFWPGENPIGRTLRIAWEPPDVERSIVGVVADTRIGSVMETEEPYFYLPYEQTKFASMHLIAQVALADPLQISKQLRDEVAGIDPNVPVLEITTMKRLLQSHLHEQQVSATIVGGLGLIGMVLARVGLYGQVSHSVAQRSREIGIRVALGARRRNVIGMLLRQTVIQLLIGSVSGLVGAAYAAQILSNLVYGVSIHDPITFGGVVFTMFAVALLACVVPARRATQIDPVAALRTS